MADTFATPRTPPLLPLLKSARRPIHRAIQTNGLIEALATLTQTAPYIPAANQRLSAYLPGSIRHPYSHRTLFSVCLSDAARDAFADPTCGAGDVSAYFATLIERASMVLRLDLADARGRWDPLYGEPLAIWMRQSKNHPITDSTPAPPTRVSLTEFTAAMCHRLLPASASGEVKASLLRISS